MKLRKSADTIHNAIMNNAETILPGQITPVKLTEKTIRNFWKKVDQSGDCWIWTGGKNEKGYGHFNVRRKYCAAHRFSWILNKGAIPEGLHVLHDCPGGDNPSCVNPDHLWLGTNLDNVLDKEEKGRGNQPAGERNCKAKLSESQVLEIRRLSESVSRKSLAETYGVTTATICGIILRQIWKHI